MWRVGAAPSLPLLLVLPFFALCCCSWWSSPAQALIPARYDGFVYRVGAPVREDSIVVEAFFDPLCPDSRDAWPPLKRVLHEYTPRVFLVVHPFPLPTFLWLPSSRITRLQFMFINSSVSFYHENSFLSCRALHIANKLNTSTTYPLLELFFKHQETWLPVIKSRHSDSINLSDGEIVFFVTNKCATPVFSERWRIASFMIQQEKLYNKPTQKMSRESVTGHIINLAVEATGNSSTSAFHKGFEDPKTDRTARNSFNYGCSRGVTGTPFFLVNGFALPGVGSALGYEKWRSIIDPLLSEHSQAGGEEAVLPFI